MVVAGLVEHRRHHRQPLDDREPIAHVVRAARAPWLNSPRATPSAGRHRRRSRAGRQVHLPVLARRAVLRRQNQQSGRRGRAAGARGRHCNDGSSNAAPPSPSARRKRLRVVWYLTLHPRAKSGLVTISISNSRISPPLAASELRARSSRHASSLLRRRPSRVANPVARGAVADRTALARAAPRARSRRRTGRRRRSRPSRRSRRPATWRPAR